MKTKKKMKTKMFLGVLLSLALVLGLLPAAACAAAGNEPDGEGGCTAYL